ncbi:MAG: acyltransferase [Deltaproteobacteria bacterium]|nr:acyltransferase [Deltaproteobacteria bacterium]
MDKRIDVFDTLRFFAIMPVAIHHAYSPGAPGGYLGVYLFFVISGYLIAFTVQRQSTLSFLARRICRIYIPMMVLLSVWLFLARDKFATGDLFDMLLGNVLVYKVSTLGVGTAVLWTLHAEIWFYILAPLLFFPLRRLEHGVYITLGLVAALAALALAIRFGRFDLGGYPFSLTLRYFHCFAVGIVLYILKHNLSGDKTSFLAGGFGYTLCLASLLVLMLMNFLPSKNLTREYSELAYAILGAVIAATAMSNNLKFDNPLTVNIGRISYSMYLIHGIILDFRLVTQARNLLMGIGFYKLLNIPAQLTTGHYLLLYLSMLLTLSAAAYFAVEKPGISLGRVLARRLRVFHIPSFGAPGVPGPAYQTEAAPPPGPQT